MKTFRNIGTIVLLLAVWLVPAHAQENGFTEQYSLWLGSHYTAFDDYAKKVGEYRLVKEDPLPEFRLRYTARGGASSFLLDGHYLDWQNIRARAAAVVGDRFTSDFRFRSFTRQLGQDLLANMETREWLGTKPGGKMLTHEITDPNADYNYTQREILTRMSLLLARKNNLRLVAAHRTILENGSEQKIASNHCFSCHLTSQGTKVDRRSHQVEAGLDGTFGGYDAGYRFGYRTYRSEVPPAQAYYDPAVHPVLGTAGAEFGSRVIYDDTTQAFSVEPRIEKFSHRIRIRGEAGPGRLAGTLTYSRTRNKGTDLAADAWVGSATYTIPVSDNTRVIARATGQRLRADDIFIDLPTFREGRPGFQGDFDFTRYSSLDRADGSASVQVIHRLNSRMVVSATAGFRRIDRYDYPVVGDGTTTDRFTGQASVRYRRGLKYSTSLKYRFEKTSDPFVVGKGLFERNGSQVLGPLGADGFVFYFQREDLRYQPITTEPTARHDATWSFNWRPTKRTNLSVTVRASYDKNDDLDSLDVKHWSVRPNLSLSYTPDPRWSFTGGYTYQHYTSRGPVAVALFDG